MSNVEVIKVHDNSTSEDGSPAPTKKSKKRTGKKGYKGKKKKAPLQSLQKQAASLKDCHVQHSRKLTELHDEAVDRFKSIRMRLNNLAIERTQDQAAEASSQSDSLEGKAGKSHFEIQVGEVRNLYKSAKHAVSSSDPSALLPTSTLDLHGCTREEALAHLDKALEVWVDDTMRASDPFVRPASIVC
ncbi:LOW QUALITY PROTEIN: hypothetical protein ACHAWF_013379, partial [Thalassiosira exigua]